MAEKPTYEELEQRMKRLEYESFKRKQTEEALRESEDKYSKTFHSAPVMIAISRLKDGKFIEVNDTFNRFFGYDREESIGHTSIELGIMTSESREKMLRLLSEDTIVYSEEMEFQAKNGVLKLGLFSGQIIEIEGEECILSIAKDITEHKQEGEAIRESEEKYRNIFESQRDAAFVADLETGMLIDANKQALQLVGRSLGEISKMHFTELHPLEQKDEIQRRFKIFAAETDLRVIEADVITKEGKTIPVAINTTIIVSGGKQKMLGLFRNITNEKQIEEALQESENKYRSMMEAMDDEIYICSPDFRVEYMNPAMIKRTGRDAIGEPCYKVIHDLDEKCPWCIHEKVMNGENSKNEVVSPEDDKTYHISNSPIFHTDRSISKLTVFRDISAYRRLERDYQTLFREMLDGFALHEIICDAQGNPVDYRFLAVNPAFEHMTGLKEEDAVGKTVLEVMPGIEPNWIETFGKVALTGEPTFFTSFAKELDKHFEVTVFRPAPNQFACVFTDITERRRLETRLQQAQKMEAIGSLAGGIAHDFNNILFPIFGYLEMMLEDVSENNPLRGRLAEVFNGAQRAKDLVQQILTFSRQSDHEPKPLKTQLVINEALKLIKSSLPSTIEISQYIKKDCGLVFADPTQIHQVVMNLCTNAYHSMEEAGGKLIINLKEVELTIEDIKDPAMVPGPHVCLTVTDTGPGMDKNIITKIFDPYFTTKEEGKGTGLGLAVVHGIVKSHGGHILVYSEPGIGTEFQVYLPVIKPQETAQQIKTDVPILKGDERILLVDDQEHIVEMERQMLERLGYHITARTSSIECFEAFRAAPDKFDLVITDMTMPQMTGVTLSEKLKEIRSDIPVIICTGYSSMIDEDKAKAIGIDGYVIKPIVKREIAKTIREVLDKRQ